MADLLQFLDGQLELQEPINIVDVGANPTGAKAPYRKLLQAGLCHVTGFEPQKEAYERLMQEKGPHETYFPHAIGDGKKHKLNLYQGSGFSSIFPLREKINNTLALKGTRFVGSVDLVTKRLDELPDIGQVDFLKIDIQGGEVAALENAAATLEKTVAVQTEVRFFPLYEGEPAYGAIHEQLTKLGFNLHNIVDLHRKPLRTTTPELRTRKLGSQLVDGDMVYVRSLEDLSALTPLQLKKLAMLASSVFSSHDLAIVCMEHLAKTGAIAIDCATQYYKLLT